MKYDLAVVHSNKCIALLEQLLSKSKAADVNTWMHRFGLTLTTLGEVRAAQCKHSDAIVCYFNAIEKFRVGANFNERIEVLTLTAKSMLALRRIDEAFDVCCEVLTIVFFFFCCLLEILNLLLLLLF